MDQLSPLGVTPTDNTTASHPVPVTRPAAASVALETFETIRQHAATTKNAVVATVVATVGPTVVKREQEDIRARMAGQKALGAVDQMTISQLRTSLTLVAHVGLGALTLTATGFEVAPTTARFGQAVGVVDSFVASWISGRERVSSVDQTKEHALNMMIARIEDDPSLLEIAAEPKFQAQISVFSKAMLEGPVKSFTERKDKEEALKAALATGEWKPEVVKAFDGYLAVTVAQQRNPELISQFFALMTQNIETAVVKKEYIDCLGFAIASADDSKKAINQELRKATATYALLKSQLDEIKEQPVAATPAATAIAPVTAPVAKAAAAPVAKAAAAPVAKAAAPAAASVAKAPAQVAAPAAAPTAPVTAPVAKAAPAPATTASVAPVAAATPAAARTVDASQFKFTVPKAAK